MSLDINTAEAFEAQRSATESKYQGFIKGVSEYLGASKNSQNDKAAMEKVARGFESLMLHMTFKGMRKAMLENSENSMSAFGADTMLDYSYMLLSDKVSQVGKGTGIAEKIYEYLTNGEKMSATEKAPKEKIDIPVNKPAVEKNKETSALNPRINYIDGLNERLSGYDNIISEASEKYGVAPNLIKAIISSESAAKPNAISSAGAKGLMQLMDSTANWLGVNDSYDPQENIMGGTEYISMMLDRYEDLDLALAAYNAGPGNVAKYNGVPPFDETRTYLKRVKKYLSIFENQFS